MLAHNAVQRMCLCSVPSELRTHLKCCRSDSPNPGFIGNSIAQDQKKDKGRLRGSEV